MDKQDIRIKESELVELAELDKELMKVMGMSSRITLGELLKYDKLSQEELDELIYSDRKEALGKVIQKYGREKVIILLYGMFRGVLNVLRESKTFYKG